MGANSSKSKYIILYGVKDSGKTLMQYSMQSTLKDLRDIQSTEGYNYEEVQINNTNLGVFDVSGDPKQYEIVNIISKCVNISGLIFMVPLDRMEELDKSRDLLNLFLSNNYLKEDLAILIVYNYRTQQAKENLSWITENLLDSRMGIERLKEQFSIENIKSVIVDVANLDNSNFMEVLEGYVKLLEKSF
jgi:signal recognition particle receptor subunit beta